MRATPTDKLFLHSSVYYELYAPIEAYELYAPMDAMLAIEGHNGALYIMRQRSCSAYSYSDVTAALYILLSVLQNPYLMYAQRERMCGVFFSCFFLGVLIKSAALRRGLK